MGSRINKDKPRLVLIGNGMAGIRTLEELLAIAPDRYSISVVGEEHHSHYNRILLSPVLAGEKTVDQIYLKDDDWYRQQGIFFFKGEKAIRIDRARRMVHMASGLTLPYDKLILATGARPATLPVPGNHLNRLLTFRDIRDVDQMLQLSRQLRRVAVIGGGLLGLEAANGLRQQGMDVTVVHSSTHLLNKQLDATAAQLLQQTLEHKGIHFRMNTRTCEFLGDGDNNVRGIQFTDGNHLDTDMVIVATGIVPNTELARASGLQCDNGVMVTDTMQTYDPAIYAVGECIQHRGRLFGLVAPLYDQARVCANHLAEMGIAHYQHKAEATKLKITGINAFSAGHFLGDENCDIISFHDRTQGIYKKLVIRDQHLAGVILYGDTQDGAWFFDLIRQKTDITPWRDQLVFGRDFCNTASEPKPIPVAA